MDLSGVPGKGRSRLDLQKGGTAPVLEGELKPFLMSKIEHQGFGCQGTGITAAGPGLIGRGRQRFHKGAEAADGLIEPGPEREGQGQPVVSGLPLRGLLGTGISPQSSLSG